MNQAGGNDMRLEDSSQDEGTVTSPKEAIEDKLKEILYLAEHEAIDAAHINPDDPYFGMSHQTAVQAIQAIITTETTKLQDFAVELLKYQPARVEHDSMSCAYCGGAMDVCRPEFPGGKRRLLCATCLDDIRLDAIQQLKPQVAGNDMLAADYTPASGDSDAP